MDDVILNLKHVKLLFVLSYRKNVNFIIENFLAFNHKFI